MGLLAAGLLSGAASAWALKVRGRCSEAPASPSLRRLGNGPTARPWRVQQHPLFRTQFTNASASSPGAVLSERTPLPCPCPARCVRLPPTLQQSADAHTLDSDTSENLQLGLMGLGGAALGVHLLHGGLAGPRAGWPSQYSRPVCLFQQAEPACSWSRAFSKTHQH